MGWHNIQNRGMVLMYMMVMVLIYMQGQKYYEGGGLKYPGWPNIQNREKHRPLRLMPPLTEMASGKTLLIDISPTNDPKHFFAYLKKRIRGCAPILENQHKCSQY